MENACLINGVAFNSVFKVLATMQLMLSSFIYTNYNIVRLFIRIST